MPPCKAKKSGPRDHAETLEVLCVVCFRKEKNLKNISQEIVAGIKAHVSEHYKETNKNLPQKICSSCRNKIVDLNKKPTMTNTLPKPAYQDLRPPRPATR